KDSWSAPRRTACRAASVGCWAVLSGESVGDVQRGRGELLGAVHRHHPVPGAGVRLVPARPYPAADRVRQALGPGATGWVGWPAPGGRRGGLGEPVLAGSALLWGLSVPARLGAGDGARGLSGGRGLEGTRGPRHKLPPVAAPRVGAVSGKGAG